MRHFDTGEWSASGAVVKWGGRCQERCEQKAVLQGHSKGVQALVVLDEYGRAASGSIDKTIRIWNVYKGHCERVTIALLCDCAWMIAVCCVRCIVVVE